jgi:hypothetical protein
MKKPKIKLDGAKLQALFVQHVEKLLLVVVVGMMLFLVYQGFSLPGLEPGKTPQGLLQTSKAVMEFIDNPNRWNEVRAKREVIPDVANDVVKDQIAVDANQYFLPMRWEIPNFPKLSPRTDPKIFAPLHLVVVPKIGPLAYLKPEAYVDPLAPTVSDEEGATTPTRPKPKPKAKPKAPKRANTPPGADPMAEGMGPPSTGTGRKPRRGGGDDILLSGMPMGEPPSGPAGMGMPDGMGMGTGAASPGAVNPEAILGFTATDAAAKNTHAVVVMAVVPNEKQFEEYQNALANSLDYDQQRDTPFYLQYYVQRADVTDDPAADLATLKWEDLGVNAEREETYNWAGTLAEIVDRSYIDENLTHPAPPFMQRDLWDLLTHPDVPLPAVASAESMTGESGLRPRPKPGKSGPASDRPTFLRPPRAGGGAEGMGAAGMGMPMPGGHGQGVPPGTRGAIGAPPSGAAPAVGPGRTGGATGMPAGMPGMGQESGYGSGSLAGIPPAKYKLIRFTDTTVEPGHKYRYHVKVLAHDPNHPATEFGYVAPNIASLDSKVRERIKSADPSMYWLESDWSEPSPVAELPAADRYFAGTVKQPDAVENLIPGKPPIPNSPHPVGKALAVVWDETKAVDVPVEIDVHRGSIFNFVHDARVIHPVTHQVVDLPGYAFSTNAIVCDMMGGEEIPLLDKRSEKPKMIAPGEMLIIDSAGKLHVQDETDDIEAFRRFLIPEEPEQPTAAAGGASAEGFGDILSGAPGAVGKPPGMPGAPTPKSKRN